MKRRALVTGATGGLGRTLVPALVAAGYEVTATGRDAAVGATLEAAGAHFVAADLRDTSADPLLEETDVVFHLAALSSPWGRPCDFAAINVAATHRLLDRAREAGCDSFVYASTPSIYAEPRDRLGLTEQSPPARRFANLYAATKFEAEQAVLAADADDFRTIAIRPRAIVGPHDAVLLPRLIRASRSGRMPLPNGGRALIELTDVRDAAAAFFAADAARERAGGQAFNISGGQPRRLRDLLGLIFTGLGTKPRLVSLPAGPAMAAAWLAERAAALLPGRPEPPATRYAIMALGFSQTFDLGAARERLGWSPRYSPEGAIAFALGREPAQCDVMVSAIRVGHCLHPQIMSIQGGSLRPVVFPALAMLMVHPEEGPILFDTGYDPAFFEATRPFPERFYRWMTPVTLKPGEELGAQLAGRGIAPADVRHVILSHFHADHMAGLHAFPQAAIHCARAGLDAACGAGRLAGVRKGILRALFPADIQARARFFEDAPRVALPAGLAPFDSGADLFGDGSVLAVELPGHCPGHWGLAVEDAEYGLHFMVGDAAWSSDAIRRNMPPPAIASGFLGDTRRVRETLARLHALWRRNPDVRLTPCHCPERAAEAVPRGRAVRS